MVDRINMMSRKKITGFSLIELSVVVMIVGLMTIPLFQLYEAGMAGQDKNITEDNITTIMTELGRFQTKTDLGTGANGLQTARLPCPSDRNKTPADIGYLQEFNPASDGHGRCTLAELAAMPAPLNYVSTSSTPVCTVNGGFCITRGAKTDPATGITTYAPVLVGGVPLRAMNRVDGYNIPENTVLDGWLSQLTYAVTLSLTSGGTYGLNKGYISVNDEHGNPTGGVNNDGDYLIFSHGPNRMGAFTKTGNLVSICGMSPYGIAREIENCDNDSTFVQALTGSYRQVGTSAYYDDTLRVNKTAFGNIWAHTISSTGGATTGIYNLNLKSVGVKTPTPTAKIEVASPVAGMDGTVRGSHNLKASMICNKDGTNCFKISAIAGSSFVGCGANKVMTGAYTAYDSPGHIGDPDYPVTHAKCDTPPFPTTLSSLSCPIGPPKQYLVGFTVMGAPVCKTLP